MTSRLPPPQEDKYPKVHEGNRARQRWFWAIARVLRHIHRPAPRSFTNPLARPQGPVKSHMPPATFDRVLNYDPALTPPLNSVVEQVTLPPAAAARLSRNCRDLGVSFGSGLFTLVGMSMMALRERFPLPKDADHSLTGLPFVGSFPINARPFFDYRGTHDSVMLAFSEGVVLPFLDSSLPAEARFRLLVRQADRQLALYQKGVRAGRKAHLMGAKSPSQLVPGNYIANTERAENRLPAEIRERRAAAGWRMPQGDYPVRQQNGLATCGITSTGDRSKLLDSFKRQLVSDHPLDDDGGWKVEVDSIDGGVRVRDGEFLVHGFSHTHGLQFSVSYDACTLDEAKVGAWREIMMSLLNDDDSSKEGSAVKARL